MVGARVLLPREVQARPVESLRLAVALAHAFAQATTPGWLRPVVAWAPLPAWLVFVGAHVLAGGSARLRTERGVAVLLLEVRGWRYWAAIAGCMGAVVLALAAGARAVLAVAAVAGTWVELAGAAGGGGVGRGGTGGRGDDLVARRTRLRPHPRRGARASSGGVAAASLAGRTRLVAGDGACGGRPAGGPAGQCPHRPARRGLPPPRVPCRRGVGEPPVPAPPTPPALT